MPLRNQMPTCIARLLACCAQSLNLRRHCPTRIDQISHQPLVDIEIAFVLSEIANGMTFSEDSPYVRS